MRTVSILVLFCFLSARSEPIDEDGDGIRFPASSLKLVEAGGLRSAESATFRIGPDLPSAFLNLTFDGLGVRNGADYEAVLVYRVLDPSEKHCTQYRTKDGGSGIFMGSGETDEIEIGVDLEQEGLIQIEFAGECSDETLHSVEGDEPPFLRLVAWED